ncbi:DUF6233 domain-containing protein [Streptomyces sp. DT195]
MSSFTVSSSRRTRGITRQQAADALREQVPACFLCRPALP